MTLSLIGVAAAVMIVTAVVVVRTILRSEFWSVLSADLRNQQAVAQRAAVAPSAVSEAAGSAEPQPTKAKAMAATAS